MMNVSTITRVTLLASVLSLAGCKNDGANPVVTDNQAATTAVPGTGAGNSATGATGGTATSPGQDGTQNPVGATPGTSGAATSTGGMAGPDSASGRPADTLGTPQPGQNPNTTQPR